MQKNAFHKCNFYTNLQIYKCNFYANLQFYIFYKCNFYTNLQIYNFYNYIKFIEGCKIYIDNFI